MKTFLILFFPALAFAQASNYGGLGDIINPKILSALEKDIDRNFSEFIYDTHSDGRDFRSRCVIKPSDGKEILSVTGKPVIPVYVQCRGMEFDSYDERNPQCKTYHLADIRRACDNTIEIPVEQLPDLRVIEWKSSVLNPQNPDPLKRWNNCCSGLADEC